MNRHLNMYKFLMLALVESLISICLAPLTRDTFDCNSNVTITIQILRLLYIRVRRCFLSYNFTSEKRLHNMLQPEMKSHFCKDVLLKGTLMQI